MFWYTSCVLELSSLLNKDTFTYFRKKKRSHHSPCTWIIPRAWFWDLDTKRWALSWTLELDFHCFLGLGICNTKYLSLHYSRNGLLRNTFFYDSGCPGQLVRTSTNPKGTLAWSKTIRWTKRLNLFLGLVCFIFA